MRLWTTGAVLVGVLQLPGCIWVTDSELTERVDWLEDQDQDGSIAMQHGGPDCDDDNPDVNPSADEVPYDGLDNDCNSLSLDDDLDEDGFKLQRDCDDTDPEVHPDATEVCDGIDNDCDDRTDDSTSEDAALFYLDTDGDGFGDQVDWSLACEAATGEVAAPANDDDFDCDDSDASIFPGADEYCDEIDNDCDGVIDEQGAVDQGTWYPDRDGDGFGETVNWEVGCSAPTDYLDLAGDCDDNDPNVHPDAIESLGDLEDRDCDGSDDGFAFMSMDTHSSVTLIGPRLVMSSTSGGPLLYMAWLAAKCSEPASAVKSVLGSCMLFTTIDFASWSSIREGGQGIFIETSDDTVEVGNDADFVADPIYAAWIRDVESDEGPELRVYGINRVTEATGEQVLSLSSGSVSRVQGGLYNSQLTAMSCSEGGELGLQALSLSDLVDGTAAPGYEFVQQDIISTVCEIDEYSGLVYTAEYGGDLTTWTVDFDSMSEFLTADDSSSDSWFLDLEYSLSESTSALVGSHDDASSRLFYSYEQLDERGVSDEDWVYTSEIFQDLDLATTDNGVGWVCGVTNDNEPYLVSVDLEAINPVSEYALATSVGLGVVDDCAIASTTIDQEWISVSETGNVVTNRQVQVVVVAFRSDTVLKWGVVEAY
jgi:hypothetical protein